MIKAVVFDLDDTLFLESDYVQTGFACVEEYISKNYLVDVKKGLLYDLFLKDKRNVYDRALDSLGINYTKSDMEKLVEIYHNHIPRGIKLTDGALEVLKHLKTSGYKLGMITDGRPVGQNNKIDCLGIRDLFDKIIITDDLGIEFRKPNEKAFTLMAQTLGVKYEEMVYIGDNATKDFAVMKKLPIKTIQFIHHNRIYSIGEYLFGIKPIKIITCYKQLIDTIGEL